MDEQLTEQGIVLKSENGFTEIELLANENCEECSAKLFCKPKEDSSRILKVNNSLGIAKGDKVSISISGKSLLNASIKFYFYPLLLLISSIFLGMIFFTNSKQPELYSLLVGLALVVIYYYTFFLLGKNGSKDKSKVIISKIH